MAEDTLAARLMRNRSISPAGCWVWTGAVNSYGYGIIKIGGRAGRVERCHRIAYSVFIGPIARGACALHRCDNPPCFSPDHLFSGTKADNTRDMIAKGRFRKGRPAIGELSGTAKLTEPQVLDAITRLLAGETRARIARSTGVTLAAISKIATGKNWKHLTAGRGITKSTRGTRMAAHV